MNDKVSVLIVGTDKFNNNLLESIEKNLENIKEVIYAGDADVIPEEFNEISVPLKRIDTSSINDSYKLNLLIEASSQDFLFLVDSSCEFGEDTIEEVLETYESTRADIVYPNIILKVLGEESIVNYTDVFGKEKELLTTLRLENYVPQWGILVRKGIFKTLGFFDESLEDFGFYDFLYRNLKTLRMKLSEFSFVKRVVHNSFIDTSYRSYVIRKRVLKMYDWKEDIFPFLSWRERAEVAIATALTIIGNVLASYYDFYNAVSFYNDALKSFYNKETLKSLVNGLISMGKFKEAKNLVLSNSELLENMNGKVEVELIERVEDLILEIEKLLEKGMLLETLKIINEVSSFYLGAPVYNILGYVNWSQKRYEDSYKCFYKAVTMNPTNEDFVYNLLEVSKCLGKEENVKKLLSRIVE